MAKSTADAVRRRAPAAGRAAFGFEAALYLIVAVSAPMLALLARGNAPLAAAAGVCAAGLVATNPPWRFTALRPVAAILGALLLWGGLSALWSIDPGRSMILELRLAGLFAAGLALAAAAGRIAVPRRLWLFLLAGTALGAVLALGDLATAGGLSRYVSVRPFIAPRLNQLSAWIAILLPPVAALLVCRGRRLIAVAVAGAMAATVYTLDGTAAKTALALSLPVAALLYFGRAWVARAVAALSVIAILTAPLTLPQLAQSPRLFAAVDAFKDSAGHRLLIWSFAGERISERPFVGWGLDSSRAIPGGRDEIRPGQQWLPLHPHNAALQLWLELGAPGAALFALLVGWLWLRLAEAPWPRLYAAAAGGSLFAALAVADAGWGVWEEWWIGTLGLALFAVLVIARAAGAPREATTPPPRPGSRASGR